MSQKLAPLLALQKLDLRIMEIKDQRRKIPERLSVAEAPLRELTQQGAELAQSIEGYAKERRSREKDLETHEAQTEKMKSHAANLKTNKEYQAHLFEVELANKKRGEIEEQILLVMEKIEQAQQAAKEVQAKADTAKQVFTAEKKLLDGQDRELAEELAKLEAEHATASQSVDKGLLARYNQVRAAKKEQAMAAVRNGMCAGCRLQIPPQLIAQVRRSEDLHLCPYCRRILYWEGEAPTEKPSALSEARKSDLEMGESL